MAEIVRTAIGPDERLPARRTFEERVMVRLPGAYAALSRAVNRLPPRSGVRRALLCRNAMSGWGAWVRGDLDLCLVRFSRQWEYHPPREWLVAGMPENYRGHEGLREWFADLREAWEFLEHRPLEIADGGRVFAFYCKVRLRSRTSGIELDSPLGQVFWLERGLIARERDFSDWEEALGVMTAHVAAETGA